MRNHLALFGMKTAANAMYARQEIEDRSALRDNIVPSPVIGEDERRLAPTTPALPARAIVQVLLDTVAARRGVCIGAVTSQDTVPTADDCVREGTSVGRTSGDFRVIGGVFPFGQRDAAAGSVLNGWFS